MEGLSGLSETFGGIVEDVKSFVVEKPFATAAIGAGIVTAAALGTALVIKKKAKVNSKKKKKRTKKGRRRDWRFASKQKHEVAYRKRRKKLGRKSYQKKYKTAKRVGKIYYTKKGQPYKILASGKARFIKKTKGRKK